MAKAQESQYANYMEVIGKSLAFLCLDRAGLRDEQIPIQADFLQRLGLDVPGAAKVIGTSEASLRVLLSRKKTKGAKSNASRKRV